MTAHVTNVMRLCQIMLISPKEAVSKFPHHVFIPFNGCYALNYLPKMICLSSNPSTSECDLTGNRVIADIRKLT